MGSFQPQQPLACDTFKNCEGLSRVAFMDGNGVVMLGKVISWRGRRREARAARRSEAARSLLLLGAACPCTPRFAASLFWVRNASVSVLRVGASRARSGHVFLRQGMFVLYSPIAISYRDRFTAPMPWS